MIKSRSVQCAVINERYCMVWLDDGVRVAYRMVGGSTVVDERKEPPFYQILPCPYCGIEEGNDHDPLKHVDARLGRANHSCTLVGQ